MIPIGVHAAALGLVLVDILVRGVRLRLLLGGHRLPLRRAIAVNAIGDAASAVTPARLGGEPARYLSMGRYDIPPATRVVALAAERVVDLSMVALVTLGVVLFLGERGFADLHALAVRLTSARALPWVLGVAAAIVGGALLAVRMRHRLPRAVGHSLREAIDAARLLPTSKLAAAAALTPVSMAARVAILPVLLAGAGILGRVVPAVVGSFALLYSQLVFPIPAGAGGVELGFVAGVLPLTTAAQTAALLVTWRAYTLIVPVGLGLGVWLATGGREHVST